MRGFDEESGQALVELVFVLPILLIILFGIIEFANAWRTSELITNAAREGSRRGVVANAPTKAELTDTIKAIVKRVGLDENRVDAVNFSCNGVAGAMCSNTGETQTVELVYNYDFIVLGPVMDLLGPNQGDQYENTITIEGVSSMRKE